MGKVHQRIHRKDQFEDHVHAMPKGQQKTGGMLFKPNIAKTEKAFADPTLSVHSHLYQVNGKTMETGVAPNNPDHEHLLCCDMDDELTGKPQKQ